MKTLFLSFLACAAMTLWSCSDSDDLTTPENPPEEQPQNPDEGQPEKPEFVSQETFDAFYKLFENATKVEWLRKGENDEYRVAEFSLSETRAADTDRHAAWFDNKGNWYMNEMDTSFEMLPKAVQDAFKNSKYADWRIDDVDKLEREGATTVYIIEVEGMQDGVKTEMDLYYSEDGVLLRELADVADDYDYSDHIPSQLPALIEDFIKTRYPDARIIDIDREKNGMTEVEILDKGTCREVLFDASDKWIHTKTEMTWYEVPEAVRQTIETKFSSYKIDTEDIDHYEMETEDYYLLELKSIDGELEVKIKSSGEILGEYDPADPDHGGSQQGGTTDRKIEDFINRKYPGAIIREHDYDDGMIKVEIVHEGREKDVCFNGAKEWVKTTWDVRWTELPKAVRDAIQSKYSDLRVDDTEYVESQAAGEYYLVELESVDGKTNITVRIGVGGEILDDGGYNPPAPPVPGQGDTNIEDFIKQKYPGARIVEQDYEDGMIEVEIIHEGREKDVYFDAATKEWLKTTWEVRQTGLPKAVTNAIRAKYPDSQVDDAEYVETPTGDYYLVELEFRSGREMTLRIDKDGNILQ